VYEAEHNKDDTINDRDFNTVAKFSAVGSRVSKFRDPDDIDANCVLVNK
jgi:hypothetical protein